MLLDRRSLLTIPGAFALGGCQQAPRIYKMQVTRDASCGCCKVWTEVLTKTGRFEITLLETDDLPAFKQRVGVPDGLASCHTGLVDNYIIEGHVPAEDILHVLETKPEGIVGVAVPGMPRGSPGMEQPNGARDEYWVFAFDKAGKMSEIAHYLANRPS